jgi:hypothetical protein
MTDNLFLAKSPEPDDRALSLALEGSYALWRKIAKSLAEKYGPLKEEWKYYGGKLGWTMKLLSGKRNLFFFTATDGHFRISFVFREKAVAAIGQSDLPAKIVEDLKNARKYAEGRGVRIEVKNARDAAVVLKLAAFKIEAA